MNVREAVVMNSLEEYAKNHDLAGKKVLLRVDLNTNVGDNQGVDSGEDWRIIKAYRSIEFLTERGASVLVISHIGRDPEETLKPVMEYMQQRITLGFVPSFDPKVATELITTMQHGAVLMFQNLRSEPGEVLNDVEFLKPLAEACDLYVNDAFSVSHRIHASVHAVTTLLPSYFGLQFVDEVTFLCQSLKKEGTKTLLLGGAKFGTKLDLLEKLLPHFSYVLMGGALANVFLRERGFEIGKSFADDVDISSIVSNEKILLPIDCVNQEGDVFPIDEVSKNDMILDIGHQTEELFETIIAASDVVLWNGPMGKYEDGYVSGSVALAKSLAHSNAFSVTGGGDTATVILQEGMEESFDFISTGGGAMLDFLVNDTLPGIEVISKKA